MLIYLLFADLGRRQLVFEGTGMAESWQSVARIRAMQTRLADMLGQALDLLDKSQWLAFNIENELMKFQKAFGGAESAPIPDNGRPFRRTRKNDRRRDTDRRLAELAEKGVVDLKIQKQPNGSAIVQIDGGKEFRLSPVLADLLLILSDDAWPTKDDLVGWKSWDEVAKRLGRKAGRPPMGRHTVSQNVLRLRKALELSGENPRWVQSNRALGARFALRRRLGFVIGSDQK
jgi:hypothetical protein